MYRKRIAATFALARRERSLRCRRCRTPTSRSGPTYQGADGPELIVAATAHSSTRTFCGVKGYAFTFRPDRFTLHDRTDGTSACVAVGDVPAWLLVGRLPPRLARQPVDGADRCGVRLGDGPPGARHDELVARRAEPATRRVGSEPAVPQLVRRPQHVATRPPRVPRQGALRPLPARTATRSSTSPTVATARTSASSSCSASDRTWRSASTRAVTRRTRSRR